MEKFKHYSEKIINLLASKKNLLKTEEREKPIILIVDDFPQNLKMLTYILDKRGEYEIIVAKNGAEGLSLAQDIHPDIILLDIVMPDIDGLNVCRKLKENETTRDIPIIFLTGKITAKDIVEGFEAGAVDYVKKPFNSAELLARVNTHLELKKAKSILIDKNDELKQRSDELLRTNKQLQEEIKERKKAEEDRREIEGRLKQLQKLRSLVIMAGGITHDFNNILTGIIGYSEIARMDLSPDSPVRGAIDKIIEFSGRATELTRQILAYSGGGKTQMKPFNLSRVAQETIQLLIMSIAPGCHLRYDFSDSLPIIEGDDNQIRQVIMNLIINSSEAMGEGGGFIVIKTGQMECSQSYLKNCYIYEDIPEGTYVYLEAEDTGCGMTKDIQDKIFDPFFTTKFTGRGLGLAVVLGIVRRHNGAIKVQSEPGKGTTIRVLFPISDRVLIEDKLEKPPVVSSCTTGTILVIDDEPHICKLTKIILEFFGFVVMTAFGGRKGLEIFNAHKDEIDLVLLDMIMPDMDGKEVFEELKNIREGIEIVLISGYSEEVAMNYFEGKELAGFIQKPYNQEQLVEAVQKIIEG